VEALHPQGTEEGFLNHSSSSYAARLNRLTGHLKWKSDPNKRNMITGHLPHPPFTPEALRSYKANDYVIRKHIDLKLKALLCVRFARLEAIVLAIRCRFFFLRWAVYSYRRKLRDRDLALKKMEISIMRRKKERREELRLEMMRSACVSSAFHRRAWSCLHCFVFHRQLMALRQRFQHWRRYSLSTKHKLSSVFCTWRAYTSARVMYRLNLVVFSRSLLPLTSIWRKKKRGAAFQKWQEVVEWKKQWIRVKLLFNLWKSWINTRKKEYRLARLGENVSCYDDKEEGVKRIVKADREEDSKSAPAIDVNGQPFTVFALEENLSLNASAFPLDAEESVVVVVGNEGSPVARSPLTSSSSFSNEFHCSVKSRGVDTFKAKSPDTRGSQISTDDSGSLAYSTSDVDDHAEIDHVSPLSSLQVQNGCAVVDFEAGKRNERERDEDDYLRDFTSQDHLHKVEEAKSSKNLQKFVKSKPRVPHPKASIEVKWKYRMDTARYQMMEYEAQWEKSI